MIYRMNTNGVNDTPLRVVLIPITEESPNFPIVKARIAPVIEFYDLRYAGERFTPDGQFISRYNLETLTSHTGGLDLHGSEPAWKIDEKEFSEIKSWASYVSYDKPLEMD